MQQQQQQQNSRGKNTRSEKYYMQTKLYGGNEHNHLKYPSNEGKSESEREKYRATHWEKQQPQPQIHQELCTFFHIFCVENVILHVKIGLKRK